MPSLLLGHSHGSLQFFRVVNHPAATLSHLGPSIFEVLFVPFVYDIFEATCKMHRT